MPDGLGCATRSLRKHVPGQPDYACASRGTRCTKIATLRVAASQVRRASQGHEPLSQPSWMIAPTRLRRFHFFLRPRLPDTLPPVDGAPLLGDSNTFAKGSLDCLACRMCSEECPLAALTCLRAQSRTRHRVDASDADAGTGACLTVLVGSSAGAPTEASASPAKARSRAHSAH